MTSAADLLTSAAERLSAAGVPSPRVDAELLLAHVLDVSRASVRFAGDPSVEQMAAYDELVSRRAERVPLQHLTGVSYFRHIELAVGPGVFVPRPETESLAGWAIDSAAALAAPVVVDLCTGSGAIAASVADEVPSAQVHAVELDRDAVSYAERNLARSGVDLRCGDVADAFPDLDGTVDVVVANPPYIPLEAYESVAAEARDHDPDLALWSGEDGLDTIRVIERVAYRLLRAGGVVGVEHADVQGESAPEVFAAAGRWSDVRDNPDLAGRPRYLTARRSSAEPASDAQQHMAR
ncbi:peptide chain release factor N(5)-glutamine methyltransferase [Nocardioidaceae bacterium SCSIO 66511]|nr:peptide chain release factor N(5)-glutamine methyltransferase [Nocardioidaceae bacterium SCSIO 66511]